MAIGKWLRESQRKGIARSSDRSRCTGAEANATADRFGSPDGILDWCVEARSPTL